MDEPELLRAYSRDINRLKRDPQRQLLVDTIEAQLMGMDEHDDEILIYLDKIPMGDLFRRHTSVAIDTAMEVAEFYRCRDYHAGVRLRSPLDRRSRNFIVISRSPEWNGNSDYISRTPVRLHLKRLIDHEIERQQSNPVEILIKKEADWNGGAIDELREHYRRRGWQLETGVVLRTNTFINRISLYRIS